MPRWDLGVRRILLRSGVHYCMWAVYGCRFCASQRCCKPGHRPEGGVGLDALRFCCFDRCFILVLPLDARIHEAMQVREPGGCFPPELFLRGVTNPHNMFIRMLVCSTRPDGETI